MRLLVLPLLLLASGCSIMKASLAKVPPPLIDMDEPLELRGEPDDEAARLALALGSFTGIHVEARAGTLDALMEAGEGVLVTSVVENSPADQAGVMAGDAILESRAAGNHLELKWPSQWRALEIETQPGTTLSLVVDRAGVELALELVTTARLHPTPRADGERFREEEKVGLVVRTATEVEARAAGLGPGGGAVVVGLARGSPWRQAGIVFEDIVARVDGAEVAHPQVLIDAIRARSSGERMALEIVHAGTKRDVTVLVGRREHELREFSIPLLYSYSYDRGHSETSVLLGLYLHESTPAAWRTRILWIVSFGGGVADQLQEEGS